LHGHAAVIALLLTYGTQVHNVADERTGDLAKLPDYAETFVSVTDFVPSAGAARERHCDNPVVSVDDRGGHRSAVIGPIEAVELPHTVAWAHVPKVAAMPERSLDLEGGMLGRVSKECHP
jgi:hypothetical protein